MVLYDLAGDTEYHSSHFGWTMEIVMQQSPATFIYVIDLTNTDSEITKLLYDWLNFIVHASFRSSITSCILVVGSHDDLLTKEQLSSKSAFIKDSVHRRVKRRQTFVGFVTVECRKIDSAGIRQLISHLSRRT